MHDVRVSVRHFRCPQWDTEPMTDWEHSPTPGPGGPLLGGAVCLIGGGIALAMIAPSIGWADGLTWLCAGLALFGAVLLSIGIGMLVRARRSRNDR